MDVLTRSAVTNLRRDMSNTPTLIIHYSDSGNVATLLVELPGDHAGEELPVCSGTLSDCAARARRWAEQRGFRLTSKGSNIDQLQQAQPDGPTTGMLVLPTTYAPNSPQSLAPSQGDRE